MSSGETATLHQLNQQPATNGDMPNRDHADEDIVTLDQKGEFIALGSTSFVERLPNGDIVKTAWPGRDRAVERRRELTMEARIYDQLGAHSRLLRKKAWDSDECTLTLEFMPNGTLKAYLEAHQDIPPAQRLRWIKEAAEGLELLHSASIVHCNTGPHNFLVDQDLSLKISDFAGSSLDGSRTDTYPGARYAAPNPGWARGKPPTVEDDVFGLGSTMYYIMTGRAPFQEFASEEVERRYAAHDFPDLAGVPCAEMIGRCWRHEVASAREVVDFVEKLLREAP
ncbi:hypothetical protein ACJ41O_007148 [Fusarium nematophilum]